MTHFALFGPPGIGKSTIINKLLKFGVSAFDAETIHPNKPDETQLAHMVIGAAGLDVEWLEKKGFTTVLLVQDQTVYETRRSARDAKDRAKASQPVHQISTWIDGHDWDVILTADNTIISQIVALIYDITPT